MIAPEAAELFLGAPWLADLDSAARRLLLSLLEERTAAAGTVLLRQGEPGDHISFLIAGEVEVVRQGPQGQREVLATLPAPNVFGLVAFFRPRPPDYGVQARTTVRLLALDRDGLAVLRRVDAQASEQLALAAVRILADRIDRLEHRITHELAGRPAGDPRRTEWAHFRARLFDESGL